MIKELVSVLIIAGFAGSMQSMHMPRQQGLIMDNTHKLFQLLGEDDVSEQAVLLLLEAGIAINAQDAVGMTPLMHAAKNGHEEACRILLKYGADMNAQDRVGWTALMFAVLQEHEKVVCLLLNHNANVEIKDHSGLNALIYAKAIKSDQAVTDLSTHK